MGAYKKNPVVMHVILKNFQATKVFNIELKPKTISICEGSEFKLFRIKDVYIDTCTNKTEKPVLCQF
jgi:hypothetical protein